MNVIRSAVRSCALAMGLVLASGASAAVDTTGFRFQIVTADDTGLTRRIAEDLTKRMVPIFGGYRTELAQQRRMVYIAIGPDALRNVASKKCDCVIIAAYTSSQVWRSITSALPQACVLSMTAIYAEPAPADQLRLVSLLYKRPVKVAAIVSGETGFLRPSLIGPVEVSEYAEGDDINNVLNRVGRSQVLLAMPDRIIYNTENFRNILLSTYRHNQGVIGFSADMVKAGALASTYSDVQHINAHVADIATDYVLTGELAPPQFPRYFSTIVNEGVARSLQVPVDDSVRKFGRQPAAKSP